MITFSHKIVFYRSKLSPLKRRALLRGILRHDEHGEDNVYNARECMVIWVAQHLEGAGFLDSEQRQLLLEEIADALQIFGSMCTVPAPVPNYQLVFAEGRYATWTGRDGFLDLHTGQYVKTTPRPILESLGYNLTELFCRQVERCQQLQEHLEREGRDAAATEESGSPVDADRVDG